MRVSALLRRTAVAERVMLVAIGLLVLTTSFLAGAAPRALVNGYDHAARYAMTTAPTGSTTVSVQSSIGVNRGFSPDTTQGGLDSAAARFFGMLRPPLRRVVALADYWASGPAIPLPGRPHDRLFLGLSNTANQHIRYVAGRPPGPPTPPGPPAPPGSHRGRLRVDVAMAAPSAQRLGLKVGSVLSPMGSGAISVRVSGLYEATDTANLYWSAHPFFAKSEEQVTRGGEIITYSAGLLGPEGYHAYAVQGDDPINIAWNYTADPRRVTAAQAGPIAGAVQTAKDQLASVQLMGSPVIVQSVFDTLLTTFNGQLRTGQTVLALALAGLFAVSIGVLVLACRLFIERIRSWLTAMRSRGGSLPQLAVLVGGAVAMVAVPTGVAGYVLAQRLVTGRTQTVGMLAMLAIVITAIVFPVLVTIHGHRRAGRGDRRDLTTNRPTPRRLVLEALLVLLALIGTYLLRRRGLSGTADHGVDPFLSAVPVMLGLALGLVVLRGYPYPLRLLGRMTARGRSAVSFIGIARASRQGVVVVLPMVVLLLATAIVGFSATVNSTLVRAQRLAAWQQTGAPFRVESELLDQHALDRIGRVPGVRAMVPARIIDGGSILNAGGDPIDSVSVVAIDLVAYRRLVAGSPLRVSSTATGATTALFSPTTLADLRTPGVTIDPGDGSPLAVHAPAIIKGFPSQRGGDKFVVVPYTALPPDYTTTAFVSGTHLDPAALREAAGPPASVRTEAQTYRGLSQAPLVNLVRSGFGYGAVLAALYCTIAILIALIIGARARGRTMSYLRTLGLGHRQARRLAIVELAPVVGVAAVAGWALGVLLPHIIGPAMDLSPYTGNESVTHYSLDLIDTVALAGGLVVFAAIAMLIDAAISARRRLGSVLRMGEAYE